MLAMAHAAVTAVGGEFSTPEGEAATLFWARALRLERASPKCASHSRLGVAFGAVLHAPQGSSATARRLGSVGLRTVGAADVVSLLALSAEAHGGVGSLGLRRRRVQPSERERERWLPRAPHPRRARASRPTRLAWEAGRWGCVGVHKGVAGRTARRGRGSRANAAARASVTGWGWYLPRVLAARPFQAFQASSSLRLERGNDNVNRNMYYFQWREQDRGWESVNGTE